jgi:spore germination protein YaaH
MLRLFFPAILVVGLFFAEGALAAPRHMAYAWAPSPRTTYAVADSTPAQKEAGLLKRIIAFLHFRKNALAREQQRVLAIIDSTGLQKAVDSVQQTLAQDSKAATAQNAQLKTLIQQLSKQLDSLKNHKATPQTGGVSPPGDTVDVPPGGEGPFQALIGQVLPMLQGPSDAAVRKASAEHVAMLRYLLSRPPGVEDTIRINDTLSKRATISVVHKEEVRGFYPSWTQPALSRQTYAVINHVDYYGVTFEPSTGNVAINGWDTAAVIRAAQAAGASLSLTLYGDRPGALDSLLRNPVAQRRLVRHLRSLLSYHNAESITVDFEELPVGAATAARFATFMDVLSDSLHAEPFAFKINLVLPRVDNAKQYNLPALDPDVDQFLVDFTHADDGRRGPLAPLQGVVNNDIKSCISRYLASGLAPSRFLLVLPYYGIVDTADKRPPRYMTYGRIRSLYTADPEYDAATQTAFVDSPGRARIWFDDAKTLGEKYDYVLQTKLGGVVIRLMGDDAPQGELQEVLMDKFMEADTVYGADIRKVRRPVNPFVGWKWTLPFLTAKWEQYEFLFAYPCLTEFPKVLKTRWERMGIYDLDRDSVEDEAARTFGFLTIVFFLLLAGSVFLFAWQIRRMPRWKFRKYCMVVMVFLAVLVTVLMFMFAYVTKSVGGFGTSSSPQDCYDFPLSTLFWFILTGLVIGGLITRFLLFPLLKKEHIP